ncbi:Membrane-associated guanylate kinase; WW and PDZ domain-containing protein 3 [Camelus dromedarius]|uniref:Membrane-associated guanylate kinase n=1 Tax=Camelus dromedarius TaxID=9838 RepID=A0A5N4DSL2_CAMDR|nr:Membrane-associated guanylate kinase; WW and PDZ domain-containing protein 3 [Camelus dromedarius]
MSKTLKKKKHWLSKVQECAVSWAGPPGDLGAEIRGGAERGEFPYLGRLREEPGGGTCCVVSGKAPSPGDVLLEVNGTPVSGLTNRDTLAVIRHFREPIRLKTVKPGEENYDYNVIRNHSVFAECALLNTQCMEI